MEFILPIRVYYKDTDAGGVVYHANYLNFMECARVEFLIKLGYDEEKMRKDDCLFVVRYAQLDFLKPAKLYDQLEIVTKVVKIGGVSLQFEQLIRLAKQPELIFCKGLIKLGCVNHRLEVQSLPILLKEKLSS